MLERREGDLRCGWSHVTSPKRIEKKILILGDKSSFNAECNGINCIISLKENNYSLCGTNLLFDYIKS